MTGGPWHCGFPMRATGGYQCGGSSAWVSWQCENCQYQEVVWGNVNIERGVETFVPRPKKILTVLMHKTPEGKVLCRGISEDVDIFTNLLYTSIQTACDGLYKHYANRGFRCVFNLPKESG